MELSDKIYTFPFLVVFLLIFLPQPVISAGVKVSPADIFLKFKANLEARGEINVTNPSDTVALYEVSTDDLKQNVSFSRRSFILEAGESAKVVFAIRNLDKGRYSLSFNVIANPIVSGQLAAASAIKIPVSIEVLEASFTSWTKAVYFFDALLALALILILLRFGPLERLLAKLRKAGL